MEGRTLSTILVSGGAGFIGSNFIRFLLRETPEFVGCIINLDALTYAGNVRNLVDIEEHFDETRYIFKHGNICDKILLETLFAKYNIDTVVHFAAESHVDRSIIGPEVFVKTNVAGTFVLLDVARNFWKTSTGSMRQAR